MLTFKNVYELMKENNNLHRSKNITGMLENIINLNASNNEYKGVSIDSRTIEPGQIFIAYKGEYNDGHNFAKQAMDKACSFIICERAIIGIPVSKQMIVVSSYQALLIISEDKNKRFQGIRVAITGSAGKTTTKAMLGHMLANSYIAKGNLNTAKFGVPLSLANLNLNANIAIFEAGMSEFGQLEEISHMLRPDIAIITSIQPAHMGNFKNMEEIAYAKSEILLYAQMGIVPQKYLHIFKRANRNCLAFSRENDNAQAFLMECQVRDQHGKYLACKANINNKQIDFIINHTKRALIDSALACLLTIDQLEEDVEKAALTLQNFKCLPGRGAWEKVIIGNKELMIMDDSYNANAQAMIESISAFKEAFDEEVSENQDVKSEQDQLCDDQTHMAQEKNDDQTHMKQESANAKNKGQIVKKIAILGQMNELGTFTQEAHESLMNRLGGFDKVILLGEHMKIIQEKIQTEKITSLPKDIVLVDNIVSLFRIIDLEIEQLPTQSAWLIKGSRSCMLNKVTDYLRNYII